MDSIEPVISLLSALFLRLKLKEDAFSVFTAVTSAEVDAFWNAIMTVDDLMRKDDNSKKILKDGQKLKCFLDHCCKSTYYQFSIKKCGKLDCNICALPRLPSDILENLNHLPDPLLSVDGEHCKAFADLYGQETSEKDRPSLTERSHQCKSHGMPFNPNAQYAHCVNVFIICSECDKPRVLYAAMKLHFDDVVKLKSKLEMLLYTCGCSLQELGPDDAVMSRVYVC